MRHLKCSLLVTVCFTTLALMGGTARAADTMRVCIGETEHNCPASHNLFASCGTNQHAVAKEVCTVWGTNGQPVGTARYRIRHDDSKSGNACGYEFYTITCLD